MRLQPRDPSIANISRAAAKAGEPDRYLAALLAPSGQRGDLIALAAFLSEIGRIGQDVSDPMLGEIRLQWWRDALLSKDTQATGSPVADAFAAGITKRNLPAELIDDVLDAHAHRLYTDPPTDDAALLLALQLSEGSAFKLAAHILGADVDAHSPAIDAAAQAYGLARLGLRLPYELAQGRCPLPQSWIGPENPAENQAWRPAIARLCDKARGQYAVVRGAFASLPWQLKVTMLPVALVEPYLRALEREGHDPARDIAEVAPLARTTRIGWAHVRGRL